MAFLCFFWFRSLMGGWYLLVYSYSFNQLKIKILLTYLLTYLLTISHQFIMFGARRSCGRRDVNFFNCHKIPCTHVVRSSCAVIGWVPFIISHHPAKFGGHRRCARGDISLLVTSRIYVFKKLSDSISEFPSS